MRKFGLIGYPLSHSFSKSYFQEKFRKEGITDAVYENFPIDDINRLLPLLNEEYGLSGLNVTIPYKEKVIPFLNHVTEVVKETGACNCISIRDHKLTGYNTDVAGFRISLERFLKPIHNRALILGAGGAAKAVAYVLNALQIPYAQVVRNRKEKTQLLYQELTPTIIREHPLIINTTPAGMYPKLEETPLQDPEGIGARHYLYDLIYNPEKTRFLYEGETRGATIQNGHEMLIIQAEESWKIWNSNKS